MDLKNIFGEIIFTAAVDNIAELVSRAVAANFTLHGASLNGARLDDARLDGARLDDARLDGASLDGASLDGASLDRASLNGASLVRASLDDASLVRASLDGASLVRASLDGARLDGASLVRASLDGASLVRARLDGARLDDARLDGASLDGARLDDARLDGARLDGSTLPAPTVILLAHWGEVSEQLCADLMEYDCWVHGDRFAFDVYGAAPDKCPFSGHLETRAANFKEHASVWRKGIGKLCSPRDLMLRLFAEKGIKR